MNGVVNLRGRKNLIYMPHLFWTQTNQVDTAETYDIHNFAWATSKSRPTGHLTGVTNQNLVIAIPATVSNFQKSDAETNLVGDVPSVIVSDQS